MRLRPTQNPQSVRNVLLTISIVLVLAVVVAAFIFVIPNHLVHKDLVPDGVERTKLRHDERVTLLQSLTVILLLFGASVSLRQLHLSREGQITDRFTKAVDQLANKDKEIDARLGGIYALERISRNSQDDRGAVLEILSAYIRGHAPWPPQDERYPAEELSFKLPTLRVRSPDIQAAVTVLGRSSRAPSTLRLALSEVDLRRCTLTDANLESAQLRQANLGLSFFLRTNLREAFLFDANLQGSMLQEAILEGAFLLAANLRGANLQAVDLRRAVLGLTQLQDLPRSWMAWSTSIRLASPVSGADLRGADLRGADLRGALLGVGPPRGANLLGAEADSETKWPEGFDPVGAGVTMDGWQSREEEAAEQIRQHRVATFRDTEGFLRTLTKEQLPRKLDELES
jgi:hypothetical protein